jgi:hypothetical protein
MTTLKVKDLNPVQRETWDRMMALFDLGGSARRGACLTRMMALFDLGGSARRGACLTVGIPNRDFETHEFETALLAYAREAA